MKSSLSGWYRLQQYFGVKYGFPFFLLKIWVDWDCPNLRIARFLNCWSTLPFSRWFFKIRQRFLSCIWLLQNGYTCYQKTVIKSSLTQTKRTSLILPLQQVSVCIINRPSKALISFFIASSIPMKLSFKSSCISFLILSILSLVSLPKRSPHSTISYLDGFLQIF